MIFIIDTIAVIIWLKFLKRQDANVKDKNSEHTLLLFFVAGLFSVPIAFFLYDFLDPFFHSIVYFNKTFYDFFYHTTIVGPIEELSKFFIFFVLSLSTRTIKEPRDGVLQAASVALAFAAVENLFYGMNYGVENLLIRSVLTIAGHMALSSIWGLYYSYIIYGNIRKNGKYRFSFVIIALIAASFLHGMYNFLLSINLFWIAVFLDVVLFIIALKIYKLLANASPYREFGLNEHDTAVPILKHALTMNPRSFNHNQRLVYHYIYAEKYDDALKHLNACLRLRPNNSALLFFKGMILLFSEKSYRGYDRMNSALLKLSNKRKRLLKDKIFQLVQDSEKRDEMIELLG